MCVARSLKPDELQGRLHVLLAAGAREIREQQRQLDIALRREHRHEVVELEHEADVPRAPLRKLAVGELVDALAGDHDLAFVRTVEPADEIEQRRLAGARRAHQRDELARLDLEIQAVQHFHLLLAARVALHHVLHGNERRHEPSPSCCCFGTT